MAAKETLAQYVIQGVSTNPLEHRDTCSKSTFQGPFIKVTQIVLPSEWKAALKQTN